MFARASLVRNFAGLEEIRRDGALLRRSLCRASTPGGHAAGVLAVADIRMLVLGYDQAKGENVSGFMLAIG